MVKHIASLKSVNPAYGVLLTLLVALCGLFPIPAKAQLSIGLIGDQTGTADIDQAYEVLQQGVIALGRQQLDVILHVGDLLESREPDTEIRSRFQQATDILDSANVPWYLTAGDHDVNPPDYEQNSSDRSKEALFKSLYGVLNPPAAQTLYYSIDVKQYHIVVLYALEHLHTDPRWGNVYFSGLSDEQFTWLQQDLAGKPEDTKNTLVLLHQPLWYNWAGWSRVHELLSEHGVSNVIAGHFHYNQSQLKLDGIDYRVIGATGGTTKTGSENAGNLQQVTVMNIDATGQSRFTIIPLPPFTHTQWTSKPIMDRVQALDVNLGNIFSFAQNSPVYLKNGELLSDCTSNDPARLVVKGIGNAAEVPVAVALAVSSNPALGIASASFGEGLCVADIGVYGCQLAASAGVAVSNNSIVQMSQYPEPPPLWIATLESGATPPAAGTVVTLTISQSFAQDSQTYLVSKTATTTVQKCN